tara:strand:+ start:3217 stop:3549 length:333 start_codon:yes stop_codon:yes gene_type:complete
MRGGRNRQKTRAQTRKSLSLSLFLSLVVVVNNSVVLSSRDDDDDDVQWKQRTNERKFKITRSLSPSKRHNKSTVTEEDDKKKTPTTRSSLPLKLLSLSLFCSACFCVRCI